MLHDIFAWLLVGIIIAAAYPLAAWLLSKSSRQDGIWLTLILMLGVSIGTLTLLMFWEGLVGIPFNLPGVVLPYLVIVAVGGWLWWKSAASPVRIRFSGVRFQLTDANRTDAGIIIAITLIGAAILFNAAYWPFQRDDVLGIYGKYGKLMYESGALVPFAGRDDAFYQAYPMQIPLAYTFSFLAAGWENEYLARVIPALLSLACLPAAYVLGKMLYGKRAGLIAALLLAITPTFARWASSGYVDLPMAFYYTLTAIFAWRIWNSDQPIDATLLGVTLGLAAWTKNAALVGVILVGAWLVYTLLSKHISLKNMPFVIVACGAIAAPWYIRNWIEVRLIVPPTAWTDQAQRTLSNIIVFVSEPGNFAITGWLIVIGGLATLYDVMRRRQQAAGQILLLWLTVPFFAAWWLLVSYDPRFLLLFLPILTVMAGGWATRLWESVPERWAKQSKIVVALVTLVLTVYILWISVQFKPEILRNPLMGDEAKKAIVLKPNGD